MESKERKNYLTPILIFLILILLGAVVYLVIKNNNNVNSNEQNTDQTTKWEVKTDRYYIATAYAYDGEIEAYVNEGTSEILFRPDGTYSFGMCTYTCSGDDGTYSVKDNIITLKPTREYGTIDGCYNTTSGTYTIEIIYSEQRLYAGKLSTGDIDNGTVFIETTKDKIESSKQNALLNLNNDYGNCNDIGKEKER